MGAAALDAHNGTGPRPFPGPLRPTVLLAAATESVLGVAAERRPLEEVARPRTAAD